MIGEPVLTYGSTCRKANEAANMTRDLNITEASIRGDYFVGDEGKWTHDAITTTYGDDKFVFRSTLGVEISSSIVLNLFDL